MACQKKIITAAIAVITAGMLLLSGTFAWQSISQQSLNEVMASPNPGGRLHDDFHDITYKEDGTAQYETMTFDKDVYAENFTTRSENGTQIFVRVRLDEYMEFGEGAGNVDAERNFAESIIDGADLSNKDSWTTYRYGDETSEFRKYFQMDFGGKTTYMPTFNKDRNSLEAEINGTFKADFQDYTDYAEERNRQVTADAVYAVTNENGETSQKIVRETHIAKETEDALVISMETWISSGMLPGKFWVYDTDGWAYWANPVDPDSATGLLLDQISRTDEIMREDWYYAINVVAQFITYDDIGKETGSGFYDTSAGTVPTENAIMLLETIGVEIN